MKKKSSQQIIESASGQQAVRIDLVQPSIRSETGQQVAKPTQMKKSSAKRNASDSASSK
jgi:hypothetical protein